MKIWIFFATVLLTELRIRSITNTAKRTLARQKSAIEIKEGLLKLGPTFIALGQLLSARVDHVPREYFEELAILQDQVPGFTVHHAIEVIEKEFGHPVSKIFDSFNPVPIAAAHLGQVYLAVYKGNQVAVKIQRAGLKDLFDVDVKNLKLLARLIDKLDPKIDGTKRDWVRISEEVAILLFEQINYLLEGHNADRFRQNFEDVPWVKVPRVYWGLTSKHVLTTEYVPGIKISDYDAIEKAGLNRGLLAQRSTESYLTQLLRHGYFHTDPNCGNLAVDTIAGGRLIYYDFGMMSSFMPEVKRGLVDIIFGIQEGDVTDVCDAMIRMGVFSSLADRVTVEKFGRYFLRLFRSNLSNKIRRKMKEEKHAEIMQILHFIREDLLAVSDDECFTFPPVFIFVVRAFVTLEGIGKGLDPRYDLMTIVGPYLRKLIDLRNGSATLSVVKLFVKRVGWRPEDISDFISQSRKTAYIEQTLRRMTYGDLTLRVRVIDSERNFKKTHNMQENLAWALAAASFANMALTLTATTEKFLLHVKMLWLLALVFFVKLIVGMVRFRSLKVRQSKFVRGKNW